MKIVARSIRCENHTCFDYLCPDSELHFESVDRIFSDTTFNDVCDYTQTVKTKELSCRKCGEEYVFVKGCGIGAILNSSGEIIRGYLDSSNH